ncbi:MAG TPA: enoyl-CoA hydratase/isomerase family protein [Candidatus Polarisedimenticolia bacterium]|nr:enoyl-CoA hydratase/isomerase family protein [Candidatus Polarisedimenticolia bacterium]
MMAAPPVRVQIDEAGAFWSVVLDTPKANLLDLAKIFALTAIFEEAARAPRLKAIVISGEGPNFCYGASVEEHMPGSCESMIPAFGRLFDAILRSGVTCVAAVRGHCLGGGMELATVCQRVVASPDARMGQPEITLGVFAPLAAAILPERVGQVRSEELQVTGRIIGAAESLEIGLADEVAEDPVAAARAWVSAHLLPRSASSLRLAVRAARVGLAGRLRASLPPIERLYLDELMRTDDAVEGLRAFLQKRAPVWSDR